MRFFLLSVLVSVFGATANAALCDAHDVTLAESQYRSIKGLVDDGAAQPISLWEAEIYLSYAKHCAGTVTKEDFCRTADRYFTQVRGVIDKVLAMGYGAVDTIQDYLRYKQLFGSLCP